MEVVVGKAVPLAVEYLVRVLIGLAAALTFLYSALWLVAVVFDLLTHGSLDFYPAIGPWDLARWTALSSAGLLITGRVVRWAIWPRARARAKTRARAA
jgi:hypothetical protein